MISLKIASRTWGAPLLVGLAAGNAVAQSAPPGFDEHMALGMVAADTRDPAGAVEHFAKTGR